MKGKIIIAGKACSGKDYLRKKLQAKGFVYGISYTTRKPREDEVDGEDYLFVSRSDFEEMLSFGEFIEWDYFGGEYYGTTFDEFKYSNLFILTPTGIDKLPKESRDCCFVILKDVDNITMLERMIDKGREQDRLEYDMLEFDGWEEWDVCL